MDNNLKKFLEIIKAAESSSGKDTNHDVMESGIHEGQSAYGSYGLMPNTIQELVNRKRLEQPLDDEYKKIYKEDPDYVKAVLYANPQLEERLASQLAEKLKNSSQTEEEMAYKWNMGHNLKNIPEEKIQTSPYVKKYQKIKGGK